ncbi:hypothetical protein BGZ94_001344 [Podila epigama]|nr:hypothetical protein BGZ94_001344 [Podila epigama]
MPLTWRPELYFWNNRNVHLGKKIVSFEQGDEGVSINCSDGSVYDGEIVVGADGTYTMNPSGAAGALTAIHDAVTLANWINTLRSPNVEELEQIFQEYYDERHKVAKEAFDTSQMFTKTLGKHDVACDPSIHEEASDLDKETTHDQALCDATSSIILTTHRRKELFSSDVPAKLA